MVRGRLRERKREARINNTFVDLLGLLNVSRRAIAQHPKVRDVRVILGFTIHPTNSVAQLGSSLAHIVTV